MTRKRRFGVIAACVVMGLVAVVWIRGDAGGEPDAERSRVVVEPLRLSQARAPEAALSDAASGEGPAETVMAVELDRSDELIRRLVAELSSHPKLAQWLLTDELLRRFATAVEMVAGGSSPTDELDFARPRTPMVVQRVDDRLIISPGSYSRYDVAAEVFASIDIRGTVELLRRLQPLIEDAHRQVAWSAPGFEERLLEAIDHLLQVDVPAGALEVEAGTIVYSYADPGLERLSDAQRHLLRMGPRNARRVQATLRELRQVMVRESAAATQALQEGTMQPNSMAEQGTVTEP